MHKKTMSINVAVLGVVAAVTLVACGSDADSTGNISALTSETSSREVPDFLAADATYVEDSIRFLGEADSYEYFVSLLNTDSESQVCLVQVDPEQEAIASGCSNATPGEHGAIVTLQAGRAMSGMALVADDASEADLEAAGWTKVAANLWHNSRG